MAILAASSKSLQVSDLVKMFGRVFLRDLWKLWAVAGGKRVSKRTYLNCDQRCFFSIFVLV